MALDELDLHLQVQAPHPLVGTGSIHASVIEGGHEMSSFPARCVRLGERRTVPGETVGDVEHELAEVARGAAVRVIASRDPYEAATDDPFVEFVQSAAGVGGVVGAPFWTDAALVAAAGIPTVLFGPIGEGAHAEVEWLTSRRSSDCTTSSCASYTRGAVRRSI